MLSEEDIEKSFNIEVGFDDPELWKILAGLVEELDGLESSFYAIANSDYEALNEAISIWHKELYNGKYTDWANNYYKLVKDKYESDTKIKMTDKDRELINIWIKNIGALTNEAVNTLQSAGKQL